MNNHPKVQFTKDGNTYEGYEVGIGLPDNRPDYSVIKSDEFESEVRIPNSQVKYDYEDNQSSQEGDDIWVELPSHSKNDGGTWQAIDASNGDYEVVLKEFERHGDLKDHYDVGKVKGVQIDGEKYYKLYYNPAQIT